MRRRKPGETSKRGYGTAHQRERKRWVGVVEAGSAFCSRCGGPIAPGSAWHLDHSDDRSRYLGAAHARCNVKAGSRKAARRSKRRAAIRHAQKGEARGVPRIWI